jgi:type IV secretion system protein VirD4
MNHSIILGLKEGTKDELYRLYGSEHVCLHARTRQGKTRSFSIPNMFEWEGSAVVLDIKGEIFRATAGHRARNLGQVVRVFDPTARDGRSHCWNQFDVLDRTSIDRFDAIQRQSYMMFPEGDGNTNTDRFWEPAGRSALIAVCNLIAESPGEPFTMAHILHLFSRGDYHEVLRGMIKRRRKTGPPYSRLTVEGISDFLSGNTEMVEGIRKSVSTRLAPWANPRTAAATNHSDFDLRDFRRRPTTLYVRIAPGNIHRMRPLLRLLFEQLVNLNSDVTPDEDPSLNIPVFMLIDEFIRLGKMETVAESLQFLAGFGFRVGIVVQNKAQVKHRYGESLAIDIFDNMGAEIVFGTGDLKLAQEIQERIGYNTVPYDVINAPRRIATFSKQTVSSPPHRIPHRWAQDVLRMPPGKQIIFRPGMEAKDSDQLCWYEDPHYLALVSAPPIIPPLSVDIPLDDGSIVIPQRRDRRNLQPDEIGRVGQWIDV